MRTKFCRLCCGNEGTIHIFDNIDEIKPSTKIMYCCNKSKVNVEEDDALPKLICSACEDHLSQSYDFILQCESADQKLRSLEFTDNTSIEENYQDIDISYELKNELKSDDERNYSPKLYYSREPSPVLNSYSSSLVSRVHSPVLNNNCSAIDSKLSQVLDKKTYSGKQNSRKKRKNVNTKQGPIDCPSCGKTWPNNSTLLAHMRSHSDKRPFKCSFCDKTYKDPAGLKRHKETNHTEFRTRDFVCENCGKGFYTKKCLQTHTRIHTGETPYACKLCPSRFSQLGSLIRHKRMHTGEKPYKCSSCPKKFRSKSEMNVHVRVHSQEKNYSCIICNLKFKHSLSLKKHVLQHENKSIFVCDLCGKTFLQKNYLALHMSRRHSAQSGYCNICSKYASNIEMHMWKHNDYRGLKCDYCSSCFFDKKGLIRHMMYKHKDYKHKCTENGCEALFPVKQMLDFHVAKVHAPVKPFPCNLCARAFYRKSDYVRHKLGTHKQKLN